MAGSYPRYSTDRRSKRCCLPFHGLPHLAECIAYATLPRSDLRRLAIYCDRLKNLKPDPLCDQTLGNRLLKVNNEAVRLADGLECNKTSFDALPCQMWY